VTDTVKRADAAGMVVGAVERDNLWAMETPQAFRAELLVEVYAGIVDRGDVVTDEVSACELAGRPVALVENPAPNPKITFPADLKLAERLLD
jgi:2-C-methyl-D-erythritol 4-phosphate cytidylyltransferase